MRYSGPLTSGQGNLLYLVPAKNLFTKHDPTIIPHPSCSNSGPLRDLGPPVEDTGFITYLAVMDPDMFAVFGNFGLLIRI